MKLPSSLESFRPQIEATLRPCLQIKAAPGIPGLLDSRIGGQAVLPADKPFPRDFQGEPLHFLAQLNFAEMPELNGFPDQGLLQFYLSGQTMLGMDLDDPTSQKGFRLLYFPSPPQAPYLDLQSLDLPSPRVHPKSGEAVALRFERYLLPVSGHDFRAQQLGFENFEQVDSYSEAFTGGGSRVGGYPGFTQDDPRLRYSGGKDYELLFQLDSDEELGTMWGDSGIGNFFIKPDALARADFSDVFFSWDAG